MSLGVKRETKSFPYACPFIYTDFELYGGFRFCKRFTESKYLTFRLVDLFDK